MRFAYITKLQWENIKKTGIAIQVYADELSVLAKGVWMKVVFPFNKSILCCQLGDSTWKRPKPVAVILPILT